jgi:predicted transport protein
MSVDAIDFDGRNPEAVMAGTPLQQHENKINSEAPDLKRAFNAIIQHVRDLGDDVTVSSRKTYIAFKRSQNFACLQSQSKKLLVFLHLDPEEFAVNPVLESRDVTNVGHFGTGYVEISVTGMRDVDQAVSLIRRAYDQPFRPRKVSEIASKPVETNKEAIPPWDVLIISDQPQNPDAYRQQEGEPEKEADSSPVNAIAEAIMSMNPPHGTIGLFGEWGAGKSSVLQRLKQVLEEESQKKSKKGRDSAVFEFNAWQYDRPDEVMTYLFYDVYMKLLSSGLLSFWRKSRVRVSYFLSRRTFMPFKSLGALSVSVSWDRPMKIERDHYDAFRDLLVASGLKRVVILLDDLDRCTKEGVGKLVEAMSLLSSSKSRSSSTKGEGQGYVFVAAADYNYLRKSVQLVYKDHEDSEGKGFNPDHFLEKTIQVSYPIARQSISINSLEKGTSPESWDLLKSTWLAEIENEEDANAEEKTGESSNSDFPRLLIDQVLGHNIRRLKKTLNTFQVLGSAHWNSIGFRHAKNPDLPSPKLVLGVVALDIAEYAVLRDFIGEKLTDALAAGKNITATSTFGSAELKEVLEQAVKKNQRSDNLVAFFSDSDGLRDCTLVNFLEVCEWRGYNAREIKKKLAALKATGEPVLVGVEESEGVAGSGTDELAVLSKATLIPEPKGGTDLETWWIGLSPQIRDVLRKVLEELSDVYEYIITPQTRYFTVAERPMGAGKRGRTVVTISPRVHKEQILAFRAGTFVKNWESEQDFADESEATSYMADEYPRTRPTWRIEKGENYGFKQPTLLQLDMHAQELATDPETIGGLMAAEILRIVEDAEEDLKKMKALGLA